MPHINISLLANYKGIIITYCLLFFGLAVPFLLLGDVAAPYRQYIEVGGVDTYVGTASIENRKFSDYTNSYIPEISQNLKGVRSGWLALWTNQNELGRPLYQISGFSAAYLPAWVIAQFTDNPWRYITSFSLLACFFSGVFIILFGREIGLHPLAALIGGISLGASPFFMYWLTFPMFVSTWCWAAGALWGVTRVARKSDLLGWSVLAFSVYSLGMTAYPQPVVYHAYILFGYGICLAYRKLQSGWVELGKFLITTASALAVGAVLTLPVYLDLAHIATESSRAAPEASFFTMYLLSLATWEDAIRFIALSTVPEFFGNPIEATYPFGYEGLSISLLMLFFVLIGLFSAIGKTWGWWVAVAIFVILTFSRPLYELGARYLGFDLSPSLPLGSVMLPLVVITVFGADKLLGATQLEKRSRVVLSALVCIIAVIIISLGYGFFYGVGIRWGIVLISLVVVGLLAAQIDKSRFGLVIVALVIVTATVSFPLMLRQDPASIATTSPLVETVRRALSIGGRYAVADPGLPVLPPNLNATLGLASVHSYNSLSSRRYKTLLEELGGDARVFGRWNASISPDYGRAVFWMSNIGLILSPKRLSHGNLEYWGEESGVHLHKVISRMGDSIQATLQTSIGTDGLHVADPRLLPRHTPAKLVDQGDLLEFGVMQGAASVLILSQKFHRDWQAQVFDQAGWRPAKTTVVNGVFQGVLLPKNSQQVRLEFKPYARYAWIAHVFWLLLLALLGFKTWHRKRRSGGEGVSAR